MAIKFLSSENIAGDIDVNLSKNGITYLAVTNTNTGVSANARAGSRRIITNLILLAQVLDILVFQDGQIQE